MSQAAPIRAIIFDCFGVMYHDKASRLYDAVPTENHTALRDIIHAGDHGFISRDEYFAQAAELVDTSIEAMKQLAGAQYLRNDAMFELAASLKKHYKIGLLSNVGDTLLDELFKAEKETGFFDSFVESWRVGAIKPAAEIYEVALAELDCAPDECVFIDDIPANIEGAEALGMHGIIFRTHADCVMALGKLGVNA